MSRSTMYTVAVWVLRIAVALVFLMTGGNKIVGAPMMVDVFAKIGVGQWFRYLTGLIEISAALIILWPRTTFYGAMLTLPVLAGAFATEFQILHGDVIHVIVIAAFAGSLAWLTRPRAAVIA